jgi:hypothetical protein
VYILNIEYYKKEAHRITGFKGFVHRLGFSITEKHNVSEFGFVSEKIGFFSYLEFQTMRKVLKSRDS